MSDNLRPTVSMGPQSSNNTVEQVPGAPIQEFEGGNSPEEFDITVASLPGEGESNPISPTSVHPYNPIQQERKEAAGGVSRKPLDVGDSKGFVDTLREKGPVGIGFSL